MSVRRAAVLGSPIGHSLSPVLWRAAYAELGLDWTYDAIDCDTDALPALLRSLAAAPDWAGLSLTMPLKLRAVDLVDDLDVVARAVGAVNTVVVRGGRLLGVNTDAPGLVAALRSAGIGTVASAAVVGGGGTARAALWALGELDAPALVVVVRDPARAAGLGELGRRLGLRVDVTGWSGLERLPDVELVVSTTPAGATDRFAAAERWDPRTALFDVVYDPWPTPLAALAARAGATVLGGLDLLVHQAALAVELMTGRRAPVAAMRAAGEATLAARRGR